MRMIEKGFESVAIVRRKRSTSMDVKITRMVAQSITMLSLISSCAALASVPLHLLANPEGTRTYAPSTTALSTTITVTSSPQSRSLTRNVVVDEYSRRRQSSVSTHLSFRESTEGEAKEMTPQKEDLSARLQTAVTSWWESIMKPKEISKEEKQQQVVDEYLIFLGKRYNRIHETAPKTMIPKKTTELLFDDAQQQRFSIWEWLKESTLSQKQSDIITTEYPNALYVLGVAELASERLLQKRRILNTNRLSTAHDVFETTFRPVNEVSSSSGLFGKINDAGTSVTDRIRSREHLAKLYKEAMKVHNREDFIKTILAQPIQAVKAVQKILLTREGKTSATAAAAAVFAAVAFLFRPLVSIVKASVQL